MALLLRQTSALNLELQGSTGSFRVGTKGGGNSTLEVKFFLTHVNLDYQNGASAQVLKHLAPVRELFETEQLEFDEIMQRDIDDARVSAELVPYLLDSKSRDLVKLFPPIVVVVLPTIPNQNRPADRYPKVSTTTVEPANANEHREQRTRSGDVGQEVFEFTQPILDGKVIGHDLNRLKLNTERTRLVIVDGQHRAMALLALHRNLKQEWTDARRAPYKDFYEEWTPKYIEKFDLAEISLPVMFCTVPDIDETYKGDFDLKRAARSIFLTLNKTARKVSESRNRLLDDNDLIALFLRDTLSSIKGRDARSQNSLRIYNVELDQSSDRIKIESAMAITGVNHIYYLVEHLLLNQPQDVNGIRPRAGKYYKRTDLESYGAYRRLDGRNKLGTAVADATDRSRFSNSSGAELATQYRERFGTYIERFYARFAPMEAHCKASIWLDERLRHQGNSRLRPILFEGQGMSRVFNAHRDGLKERLKREDFGTEATKIEEIIRNLDATASQINTAIDQFKAHRASNFIELVSDRAKLRQGDDVHPKVLGFISDLYDNVFSSVAFQTAAVAGFFGEIERAKADGKSSLNVAAEFDKFIDSLDVLFAPKSTAQFRKLIEVFVGKLDGEVAEWKVAKTPYTFREVVYPGEMQPDQWPKYRYMMLELWKPSDPSLVAIVAYQRDLARGQVFQALLERKKDEFLKSEARREENLTADDRKTFVTETYTAIRSLLNNLGTPLAEVPTKDAFVKLSLGPTDSQDVDPIDVEEVWASADDGSTE